jgi:hypothetical protein
MEVSIHRRHDCRLSLPKMLSGANAFEISDIERRITRAGTGQPRYDQSLGSESVPESTRPRPTQCPGIGSESRLLALSCHRGLPQTFSQLLCAKKVKHLGGLRVWSSDCSFH